MEIVRSGLVRRLMEVLVTLGPESEESRVVVWTVAQREMSVLLWTGSMAMETVFLKELRVGRRSRPL